MYEIYSLNNGTVFCRYCPSQKTGCTETSLLSVLTDLDEHHGVISWLDWLAYYPIDWKATTNSLETFIADYPEYFI